MATGAKLSQADAPTADDVARGRALAGITRAFGLTALFATIVARGIMAAGPGDAAGLGAVIELGERGRVAAFLTQLTATLGILLASVILFHGLWERRLPRIYRLLSAPLGAGLLTIVMSASQFPLPNAWTTSAAALSIILAAAAGAYSVGVPRARAHGLVLLGVALSSAALVTARLVAVGASARAEAGLFELARAFGTLGVALDVVVLSLAFAWQGGPWGRRACIRAVLALSFSAFIAWGASRGSGEHAAGWQVIASRSLDQLLLHPAPYLSAPARHLVEVFALLVAGTLLIGKQRALGLQAAMALAILSRSSPDVPLCGLLLAVGALTGPLSTRWDTVLHVS